MYCPKCGSENPDDAKVCRSCSAVLSKAPATVEDRFPKTSGLAIAAFVLGLLSLVFFPTGIVAIILGIISIVMIEKSGGRLTGRVFAIIGIVLPVLVFCAMFVILLPALSRVKRQARGVLCQANLKQWGIIFAMYTDDNNGQFPERKSGSDGYGRWMDSMRDYYITAEDIRCCPVATKIANPDMIPSMDWWGSTELAWGKIPGWDDGGGRTEGYYGSYGVNGYIYVPIGDEVYGMPSNRFWRTTNVKSSSEIPMFLDCYFWCGWPQATNTPPEYDGWQNRSDENAMNRFCINRHNGTINAIFMDYHVQSVGLKELFTLNWHRGYNRANAWTMAGGVRPEDWPEWMRKFRDY